MAAEKYEMQETWTGKVVVMTTVQRRLACLVAVTFPVRAVFSPALGNTWAVMSDATESRVLTASVALGHQQSKIKNYPRETRAARCHDNGRSEYETSLIGGTHACNWLLYVPAPLTCTVCWPSFYGMLSFSIVLIRVSAFYKTCPQAWMTTCRLYLTI